MLNMIGWGRIFLFVFALVLLCFFKCPAKGGTFLGGDFSIRELPKKLLPVMVGPRKKF